MEIEFWIEQHCGKTRNGVTKATIKEAFKKGVETGVLSRHGYKKGYPCYMLKSKGYLKNDVARIAPEPLGKNGNVEKTSSNKFDKRGNNDFRSSPSSKNQARRGRRSKH